MSEPKRPNIIPAIIYRDPKAVLAWLEKAFGFEQSMVVVGADGALHHSEMRLGDGMIMVGGEFDARHKSPQALGGANTNSVHIQLADGIDAHCERARSAGATITREPADQFYGDRVYAAMDLEGHIWSFGQTFKAMSFAELSDGKTSVRERL